MQSTNILLNPDFCTFSLYRSKEADAKLADWFMWADEHLPEKQKKEIERAMKKQGRGRL